jgi:Arm DNA-binding domain/Phage integrase central domain
MRRYPSWKDLSRITKPGRYAAGHGLYMQITPAKTRSWVLRYRVGNKQTHMGLGSCDLFSLAEARDKAIEAQRLRHYGKDPLGEKRSARRALILARARAKTLKECALAYIAAHESGWRGDFSRQQWLGSLNKYVFAKMGNLPVADVDLPCVRTIGDRASLDDCPGDGEARAQPYRTNIGLGHGPRSAAG